MPVSDLFIGQSLAQFKKGVEERTRKAISIEIFDDGKPYNDAQIVGAVASGVMELGVAGFNQFADKIPAVDILEQPLMFNFDALINAAFASDGEIRGMIEQALLETMGVRVLWWQPVGNQVFFSKGRDVAEPQQIKDKKVRVFSDTMAKFVKLCGGEPTVLTSGAIHGALRDGKVVYDLNGISRETWDKIPPGARGGDRRWDSFTPAGRGGAGRGSDQKKQ